MPTRKTKRSDSAGAPANPDLAEGGTEVDKVRPAKRARKGSVGKSKGATKKKAVTKRVHKGSATKPSDEVDLRYGEEERKNSPPPATKGLAAEEIDLTEEKPPAPPSDDQSTVEENDEGSMIIDDDDSIVEGDMDSDDSEDSDVSGEDGVIELFKFIAPGEIFSVLHSLARNTDASKMVIVRFVPGEDGGPAQVFIQTSMGAASVTAFSICAYVRGGFEDEQQQAYEAYMAENAQDDTGMLPINDDTPGVFTISIANLLKMRKAVASSNPEPVVVAFLNTGDVRMTSQLNASMSSIKTNAINDMDLMSPHDMVIGSDFAFRVPVDNTDPLIRAADLGDVVSISMNNIFIQEQGNRANGKKLHIVSTSDTMCSKTSYYYIQRDGAFVAYAGGKSGRTKPRHYTLDPSHNGLNRDFGSRLLRSTLLRGRVGTLLLDDRIVCMSYDVLEEGVEPRQGMVSVVTVARCNN